MKCMDATQQESPEQMGRERREGIKRNLGTSQRDRLTDHKIWMEQK